MIFQKLNNFTYLQSVTMNEDPILQKIRDWFDELFLWSKERLKPTTKELFQMLGIDWFAEIYLQSRKYGFASSQKILADLVKLSFVVYTNLEKLPVQKKVILPKENWSYKFIVTNLLDKYFSDKVDMGLIGENDDTNTILLVSTTDAMHADIAKRLWLKWRLLWECNILWWAWIDIDHDQKILNIRDDSGSYGSCSNQFVEWMLQSYKDQWYIVTINMTNQREFFTPEE